MNEKTIRVKLAPMLNGKIIFKIISKRVFCERMNKEISNCHVYSKRDMIWRNIFGSKRKIYLFVKRNKTIVMNLSLSQLGYDVCDRII